MKQSRKAKNYSFKSIQKNKKTVSKLEAKERSKMRKKTLDAHSFAGVSPSRARAHCNEHCLCVLLFFPDPDAAGTYNRQVKMRFPDDRPKLAFVMRLPNEDPKTTLTKSLTRTSPIERSK
jgi:transposase